MPVRLWYTKDNIHIGKNQTEKKLIIQLLRQETPHHIKKLLLVSMLLSHKCLKKIQKECSVSNQNAIVEINFRI